MPRLGDDAPACHPRNTMSNADTVPLPAPAREGRLSVESSIARRRSVSSFTDSSLSLPELGQMLWACQGVTEPVTEPPNRFSWQRKGGLRSVPSAGALYPLEIYVVVRTVDGLETGVYHYNPVGHSLAPHIVGDLCKLLWNASLRQTFILEAAATFVIAGVIERTAAKYGNRAEYFIHMEVGAAGENVYLQAESLDLGTVIMGAFDERAVARILGLPDEHKVFALMPVGRAGPDRRIEE